MLVMATAALMAAPAHAHHLWVVKTDGGYVVARGTASEELHPYDPGHVTQFWAFSPDGRKLPPEKGARIDEQKQVRFAVSEPVALAAVSCDWGYRVNTTRGKKLMTREKAEAAGLRVISAFFSTQYAKVWLQDGPWVNTPVGMKFEIVPLENPQEISPGGDLPVRLLFDGSPMKEISVFSEKGEEWKTDQDGVGRIKPAGKGFHLLMARHQVPVRDDQNKDYHLYTTFFVFEVE
jgi:nickel transport protein